MNEDTSFTPEGWSLNDAHQLGLNVNQQSAFVEIVENTLFPFAKTILVVCAWIQRQFVSPSETLI